MAIKDALLPEFDHEMATARTVIERVPEDKFSYKPHEKSMSMGRLASHIAEMPTWATSGIALDSLDLAGGYQPFEAKSRAELLTEFDKNVAGARSSIAGASEAASTNANVDEADLHGQGPLVQKVRERAKAEEGAAQADSVRKFTGGFEDVVFHSWNYWLVGGDGDSLRSGGRRIVWRSLPQ